MSVRRLAPPVLASHVLALLVLVVSALAAALPLAGCAAEPAPPGTRPEASGEVVEREDAAIPFRFLVVGDGEASEYDQAWVTVDEETDVFDAEGETVLPDAIVVGARLEVWFTGVVAESYPVQGTASAVRIVSP